MFKRRLPNKSRRKDSIHSSNNNAKVKHTKIDCGGSDGSSSNIGVGGGGNGASDGSSTTITRPKSIIKTSSADRQNSITGSSVDTTHSSNNESGSHRAPSSSHRNSNGNHSKTNNVVMSSSMPPRNVSFYHVHIREYERILGDNPSCSSGAPIGIGWAFGNERTLRLDHYEENKRGSRRAHLSLTLTRQAREELLLEWGESFHDIIDAIRTNVKVKNQRRRTVNAIGTYDRWEEVMENASRKIKRTLLLKKSRKDDMPPKLPPKSIRKTPEEMEQERIQQRHQHEAVQRLSFHAVGRDVGHHAVVRMGGGTMMMDHRHSLTRESSSGIVIRRQSIDNAGREGCHNSGLGLKQPSNHDRRSATGGTISTPPISEVVVAPDQSNVVYVSTGYSVMQCIVPNEDREIKSRASFDYLIEQYPEDFEVDDSTIETRSQRTGYDEIQHYEEQAPAQVSTLKYIRALEDPRFLDAMDDPGAFYNVEDMSARTPISDFTPGNVNDVTDDDDDNCGDDEFDNLDRDSSYWEVRCSGQDCPAIRRKEMPIIISEDDGDDGYGGQYDFDSRWIDLSRPTQFAPIPPYHFSAPETMIQVEGRYYEL